MAKLVVVVCQSIIHMLCNSFSSATVMERVLWLLLSAWTLDCQLFL